MTAGGEKGFLLADALVAVLLVCLAAAAGYGVLSSCLRSSSAADEATIAGVAELALLQAREGSRCLDNPAGEPAADGEEVLGLELSAHQRFRAVIKKEVISECPGLRRWTVTVSRLSPAAEEPSKKREVRLVAGSFDPF